MKLLQLRVKTPKKKVREKKMRKVMTRSMKLMKPVQKSQRPSREETRKLTLNLTKLKKKTSQPPLKSTHLPRLSPQSRRNPRLLIKKSSKRPLTPPKKKLNLLKSKPKRPDLRRSEKERDVPDSSHQFSAHSRSNKN